MYVPTYAAELRNNEAGKFKMLHKGYSLTMSVRTYRLIFSELRSISRNVPLWASLPPYIKGKKYITGAQGVLAHCAIYI